MIITYDFSCVASGCRVHVRVDMTMHDDHEYDVDKLGAALGFRRVGPPEIALRPWQCIAHDQEAPRG